MSTDSAIFFYNGTGSVSNLINENEDRTIYFIIGGDSLEWIDKWVEGDKILESVVLLKKV